MQSTVAWSLNRDVTESRGLGPTQNFQKILGMPAPWAASPGGAPPVAPVSGRSLSE